MSCLGIVFSRYIVALPHSIRFVARTVPRERERAAIRAYSPPRNFSWSLDPIIESTLDDAMINVRYVTCYENIVTRQQARMREERAATDAREMIRTR